MPPDVLDRFLRAARVRDIAAMHALVDWPLSAAPVLARALLEIDPAHRAAAARDGVAAIHASAAALQPAEARALTELAELIDRSDATRADAAVTAAALAESVRVPDVDPGPGDEDRATLAAWRRRAAEVEQVYCAETRLGPVLLALAPDGERVVIVTKL
jgi:hypothetical protein